MVFELRELLSSNEESVSPDCLIINGEPNILKLDE